MRPLRFGVNWGETDVDALGEAEGVQMQTRARLFAA